MDEINDIPVLDNGDRLQVTNFTDYRSFLKTYFARARKKNQKFSYGAWAKKLNTKDTSTLTKIINGQREPGPRLISQFISYFKFDENEQKYFRSLIQFEKIQGDPLMRLKVLESLGKSSDPTTKTIDPADFALISDWYGFAIRQLIKIRGFQPSADWISRKLRFNVTKEQVQKMFDNMMRIGAIKINRTSANHHGIVLSDPIQTTDDKSDYFIKKYHYQMLENAAKAISEVPVESREFTALTLAFKSSRVQEAKKLIRKFKADFDLLVSGNDQSDNCDSVYQFQMQFFPLSKLDQ